MLLHIPQESESDLTSIIMAGGSAVDHLHRPRASFGYSRRRCPGSNVSHGSMNSSTTAISTKVGAKWLASAPSLTRTSHALSHDAWSAYSNSRHHHGITGSIRPVSSGLASRVRRLRGCVDVLHHTCLPPYLIIRRQDQAANNPPRGRHPGARGHCARGA